MVNDVVKQQLANLIQEALDKEEGFQYLIDALELPSPQMPEQMMTITLKIPVKGLPLTGDVFMAGINWLRANNVPLWIVNSVHRVVIDRHYSSSRR